ncbi:MAG TPA: hypothetical protein VKB67_02000 [Rhizomicrobium sp.]|nr:hypothetical protein [Rhizomicrobium sp.]
MRLRWPSFWATFFGWIAIGLICGQVAKYINAPEAVAAPIVTTAQQVDRTHKDNAQVQIQPLNVPDFEPMWFHPQQKGGALDDRVVRALTFPDRGRR